MSLWIDRDSVRLHLRALFVGVLVGIGAVLFHACLDQGESLRGRFRDAAREWGWAGRLALLSILVVAISAAAWLVRRFAPEASGSGISDVESVLREGHQIRWLRVPIVKFVSGVLGIGAGLALGREGPTVQMGASIGEMSAGRSPEGRLDLIAIGAGAGLTAAFNAPLSGMIFVGEELRVGFRPTLCSAALLAVVTADAIVRMVLGARPELGARELSVHLPGHLPLFMVLGVLTGLSGVLFNRVLIASLRGCRWLARQVGAWLIPYTVAVLVAVITWYDPTWVGGGQSLLGAALDGRIAAASAGVLLAVRFVLTVGSYSTGSAGGIFAPLLLLGALVGLLFAAALAPLTGPLDTKTTTPFVLAAMAGLFSGVVRAPLTGVLLMVEMASAYELLLPLLLVSLLAKWTADALGDMPVYEALSKV
jgi:CIC family chloride channel protein